MERETLVTTGYDKADAALDRLSLVVAAIGSDLTDNAANGACMIMCDSIDALREYINATRKELASTLKA